MAAPNQAVVFEVQVEAARARAQLADLGRSAETMGGGLDKLNRGLNRFDSATRETQKVLRGLGDSMGGTKNAGVEMLGVAGDLAGAFASGGAFTAGVLAATFVMSKLAEAYTTAKVNGRVFEDGMPSIAATIIRLKNAALEPGRKSVEDFAKQLRDFGKDARQVAIDSQQFLVATTSQGGDRLTSAETRQMQVVTDIARAKVQGKKIDEEDYKVQIALLKTIQDRQAANKELQDKASADLAALKAIDKQLDAREKARDAASKATKAAGKGDVVTGDSDRTDSDSLEGQLARIETANALHEKTLIEQAQATADEMVRIEEDKNARRIASNKLYNDTVAGLGQQALAETQAAASMGLGVFQGYVAARIAGEEHAEEKATAAFMQGIGNQLVGIGTRSLFEGGAKLFNPVTAPIGAAEMVFGGAAIAAGLGLGAAGAAIGHTAAGGTVGKPLPDKSNDRGVNSGRRGGNRSDSNNSSGDIIFNYGVMGPSPDDTARAVSNAQERAGRRGFADGRITVRR